jgi:release factor glutamine methyltransferase
LSRATPGDENAGRTVREALRLATDRLAAAGVPDAAVDARHLVAHALGIERGVLLSAPERELDADAQHRLTGMTARRAAREPVSRIIGEREFYGLALALDANTLDPRPDTETVVSVALALAAAMPKSDGPLRILDLGTGTGAIALALLAALPEAEAVATDISASALSTARRNAERHGLAGRIRFIQSRWLDDVDGRYQLVVTNPPYIRCDEIASLAPEVARWEPHRALDGGPDGLDAYRAILADTSRVLAPDGWAVFEVGHDQAAAVAALAVNHGFEPAPLEWPLLRDLGGNTRCVAIATAGRKRKINLGIGDEGG